MRKRTRLMVLAEESLDETGQDREEAFSVAWERVWNDRRLLSDVLADVLRIALRKAIQLRLKSRRTAALDAIVSKAIAAAESIDVGAVAAAGLLSFPLIDGTSLRRSTRDEVERTAHNYKLQGGIDLARGIWLESIASRVPDNETPVGEVVSEDEAAEALEAAVAKVGRFLDE